MSKDLKTPIRYYGGKQNMLPFILPLIPDHKVYTEAFVGGGAVFWAKKKAQELEVVNDVNQQLSTFYRVVKQRFGDLKNEVLASMHSRRMHQDAWVVYNYDHLFDEVKIAWSVWMLANAGFAGQMSSTFGISKKDDTAASSLAKKRELFIEDLAERLDRCTVECTEGHKIIERYDSVDTFHLIDPPYFNSDCAHYDGYTEEQYVKLLDTLSGVKGRFLLSSYPSEVLTRYISKNGWQERLHVQRIAVSPLAKGTKVEVLVANYPINN